MQASNPLARRAPLHAFFATLLLAGCGGTTGGNDVVNEIAANDAGAAGAPEQPSGTSPGTGIPSLPEARSDLGQPESDALTEAEAIADRIANDDSIERSEARGGTSWSGGGDVILITSDDGQRASYFRPGEESPFLVQRGSNIYFVTDGEPTGGLNQRGRPIEMTEERRENASRLVRRAVAARSPGNARGRPDRAEDEDAYQQ